MILMPFTNSRAACVRDQHKNCGIAQSDVTLCKGPLHRTPANQIAKNKVSNDE